VGTAGDHGFDQRGRAAAAMSMFAGRPGWARHGKPAFDDDRRAEGSTVMLSEREVSAAVGGTAYGTDGDKLGTVEAFFVDDRTGAPSWVAVSTGLFGIRHSVVPAADATYADGALRLPVTAEAVKSAPQMAGEHLDPADEEALRQHYGLVGRESVAEPPVEDGVSAASTVPVAAMSRDEPAATDGAMTRGEEQLRVGTERVAATRVRLVKYVVTEDVQVTVPIRREEIRVEEVPLDVDDGEFSAEETLVPATGTPSTGGLPDEIILHTERPVVTVEVVPVERVRLRTELVQGQETVTEQVQREQIVVDEHAAPGSRGDQHRA
jgi:stress response protein YsnF